MLVDVVEALLIVDKPMRDDFSEDAKRILAYRVAMACSNPECAAHTSGPQVDPLKSVNVGVAAHITSAAAGGPRYNPNLSSEERRSPENGIWLCQNCAKLIDNDVVRYPEVVIRAWKTLAEHNAALNVGRTKRPQTETSEQRKMRKILQWKDKMVMLVSINSGMAVHTIGLRGGSCHVKILDCDEFSVRVLGSGWDCSRSIPLGNIEFGHDDRSGSLELLERNP
jgi:hypothetical protein